VFRACEIGNGAGDAAALGKLKVGGVEGAVNVAEGCLRVV
jgi:hypothetical protein